MGTIVIGGGIIGLATAFELAHRGEAVIVVDADRAGAAASAGNAGWITPFLSTPRAAPGAFRDAVKSVLASDGPARVHIQPDPGFVTWSLRFLRASTRARHSTAVAALQSIARQALSSFDALRERGVEFEEHRAGLGVVFQQRENFEHYLPAVERTRRFGYEGSVSIYRGSEIREFDPAISSTVQAVLHLEDERHVRPESVTRGLADALVRLGGTLIEGDGVRSINAAAADGWRLRTWSGRELRAERVVVAAGQRSRALLAPLGVHVPVEVAKGTSLTATGSGLVPTHPLKLYEHMVASSPFGDKLRLSGTFDVGARGSAVSAKRLGLVLRQGRSYLEDWQPQSIERWAGHRPTSADDLPIIGAVPRHRGLYIATGHGTLGVTLGPVTGALLAREILDGDDHALLRQFRITRF